MAKKKIRNMKLEQNELQSTTIGIFESRKKSSIGIVLILTIFVLFIFFLPEISDKIDAYLHPTVVTPGGGKKPVNPNPVPNPGVNDDKNQLYTFGSDLKIEKEDIIVDSFSLDKENGILTFKVTNNSEKVLKFEDLNYYVELYNSEQTLMERVKITGDVSINANLSQTLAKNIKTESASSLGLIGLIKKTIKDYNDINLTTNEDGSASLVCTANHEKVTYKFLNNKLREVTSEVSYMTTDTDYLEKYEENKNLSNTYNGKTGVTSTLFEFSEGYNITTNVFLNEASRLYVFNADSFKLDTEPKVIKFEMEAQGFSCK